MVFLVLPAPLGAHQIEPIETGGDLLLPRGLGEQIAGNLLARELVERHVAGEGPDHPVAVGPHRDFLIAVIADAVAIAHKIEPPGR